MTNRRREKLEIIYDILSAINKEDALDVRRRPRVQMMSNLPYIRFMFYIEELLRKGFIIHKRDRILITDKGYLFLINYNNLLDLIRNY